MKMFDKAKVNVNLLISFWTKSSMENEYPLELIQWKYVQWKNIN